MSGLEALVLPIISSIGSAATAAAPYATALGTAATVGGTVYSGVAANQQAKTEAENARRIAAYKQGQLERAATEERAASLREAQDKRRQGEHIISRQRAVAASSGGGVQNPTILDIIGDTAQEAEYQAQGLKYKGENRALGLTDQGVMGVAQADSDARTLKRKGKTLLTSSILEGFAEGASGVYKFRKGYG